MDAQVAFGFHHLRDTRSYLAQGPISNKVGSYFCLYYIAFESDGGMSFVMDKIIVIVMVLVN